MSLIRPIGIAVAAAAALLAGCQQEQGQDFRTDAELSSPADGGWELISLTGFEEVPPRFLGIRRTTYSLEGCGIAHGYLPTRENPSLMKTDGTQAQCSERDWQVQLSLLELLAGEPSARKHSCNGGYSDCRLEVSGGGITAVFRPIQLPA